MFKSEIERVIEARRFEITRLEKRAARPAPQSALQTLAVMRRIDHLKKLNARGRGRAKPWAPPHQVPQERTTHQSF